MANTTAAQILFRSFGMSSNADIPEQYWELIEKHRAELIAQAAAITGNREDAEDVVQETFTDAFRDPEKIANAGSVGAWLKSINRCNALNRLRDRKLAGAKKAGRIHELPENTFTTGGFSMLELKDSIGKALETLPANLRQIVVMRYYQHLSYKEIADKLRMPIGNVGGLLMDASVRLYAKLSIQLGASAVSTSKHTQSTLPVSDPRNENSAPGTTAGGVENIPGA
jgi:RNA polymerase sigma-70 factor, ECF subfamily